MIEIFNLRLLGGAIIVLFVYFTPMFKDSTGAYPLVFFLILILVNIPESSLNSIQNVALLSFSTRISDKIVGGTYFTLLTTIGNIGMALSNTGVLFLVHFWSMKKCLYDPKSNHHLIWTSLNQTMTSYLKINSITKNTCRNYLNTRVYIQTDL